jgi:hypothetical protein
MKAFFVIFLFTTLVGCSNGEKKKVNTKSTSSVENSDETKIKDSKISESKVDESHKSKPVSEMANSSKSSQKTKYDLIFVGTVKSLKTLNIPRSKVKWAVTFNVDKVKSGNFAEKTFSIRIHSPAKSGLKVGLTYVVKATKNKTGYYVDPYQWMKIQNKKNIK